jgi:hypothetical protein
MKWLRIIAGLLLVAVTLIAPRTVQACPACTEMVVSSSEADDTDNFPAAVNQSIYVMVSVPYAALLIVGFMVYRGVKKNAAYLQAMQNAAARAPA